MNILVLKWGAPGDILASTPAIRLLRNYYKNDTIIWLTSAVAHEFVDEGDLVDLLLDQYALRKQKGVIGLIRYLRSFQFDMVFNLKWSSESADFISLICGAKVKIGGSEKRYFRGIYKYLPAPVFDSFNRHEYLKNIDIVEAIPDLQHEDVDGYLYIQKASKAFADNVYEELKNTHVAILSPGASTLNKAWPKDRYIELAKKLIEHYGIKFLITYSPDDYDYSKMIADEIGAGAVLAPKTSINEVAALVSRAKFVLCNNSGIMHIAYALKIPVICFNTSIGWRPFWINDISIERIPEYL